MTTDDRTETITDRAAIRNSADDDPFRRNPVTRMGATVGALDLDGIEAWARSEDDERLVLNLVAEARRLTEVAEREVERVEVLGYLHSEATGAAESAEAEVARLRAKVAAVEAKRDEFADLLARALPAVAALARVEAVADALTTAAKIERGHGLAYAGALIEAVQADIRAALATGEGK